MFWHGLTCFTEDECYRLISSTARGVESGRAYPLTFIAAIAITVAWWTIWDLLLGMPVIFRRQARDRTRTRERLMCMGQ